MAGIKELIRTEANGTLSFGNFDLTSKGKVSDFNYNGDIYKIKTYYDITRLEKNETFAYESVPGTVVTDYIENEKGIEFYAEGYKDTQIITAVEDECDYEVKVDDVATEDYDTNLQGKLVLSIKMESGKPRKISIMKK